MLFKTIKLPIEAAIESATIQNFTRDVRKGLISIHEASLLLSLYRKEVIERLLSLGENFPPEFEDDYFIIVME